MNLAELIKENSILGNQLSTHVPVELVILSNITINQIKPSIEYHLRIKALNSEVIIGDYDNILQESNNINEFQIPIIFWELSNLKESFVYEIETADENYISLYKDKVKNELHILFKNLTNQKLVIFNKFSHILHSSIALRKSKYQIFVESINNYLEENLPVNFFLVDLDKVISNLSVSISIDKRGFYLNKSLYTFEFLYNYSEYISTIVLSLFGKSKKAFIFDCDNTLWKGIVGEDGIDSIALSDKHKGGIYFKEVHLLIKKLSNEGVIIGICSKNNEQDVEEVFNSRKDFKLKNSDIVIKKVNWEDKATNLKNISKDLKIGIDSLVFIDDSRFEINLINDFLPEVKTFLVPERLHEYPSLINKISNLFFNLNISEEDKKRTLMYQENLLREKNSKSFENIDSYLESLDISIVLSNKKKSALDRLAQLTQKTNQFNLTTKRYSTSELCSFYDSDNYDVFSIDVSDKYGSSGITGLCIVEYKQKKAIIDTFLLSCRVLGRNIEKIFLNEIIREILNKEVDNIFASYIKTHKNSQVENFFEENSFLLKSETTDLKEYDFDFNIIQNKIKYINVIWKQD